MNNALFHTLYIAAFAALIATRSLSWRSTPKEEGEVELKEGPLSLIVRGVVGLGYIALMLVYAIIPRWFNGSAAPLIEWLRWLGVALTLGSIALLIWVHRALGKNFNTTVHIRNGHTLIEHGPYRPGDVSADRELGYRPAGGACRESDHDSAHTPRRSSDDRAVWRRLSRVHAAHRSIPAAPLASVIPTLDPLKNPHSKLFQPYL